MKTRTGKIAQLPKPIRDDLNQRLQNGKQGPELLKWLNSLPETQDLIADKFDHQPINRQNLSEWRHGGYEDWLRHQDRELRIQRIAEEGSDLEEREGAADLFENTARIAVAELMADLDDLHKLKGEARSKRLRTLTRELTRMQYAYNQSRWTELAWTKWSDRFLGPDDYEKDEPQSTTAKISDSPTRTPISDLRDPNPPTLSTSIKTHEIKPIQSNSLGREDIMETLPSLGASQPAQPPPSPVERDSVALPIPAENPPEPPIRPIRPLSPIPEIVPPDPNADFLRRMALLKSARY